MGKIRVVIIEADPEITNVDKLFSAIGGAIVGNVREHALQEARFSCETCGKSFASQQGVSMHRTKRHLQQPT